MERAGEKKKKKKYRLIELKEMGRGEAAWRVVIFDRSIEIDTAYSVQMQLSRKVSWKISRRNWLTFREAIETARRDPALVSSMNNDV